MARHSVDIGEVQAAVLALTEMAEFCEALLAGVDRAAAGVATWSGDGAGAFAELHALWTAGAALMASGSKAMVTAASTAATNYDEAAAANVRVWS